MSKILGFVVVVAFSCFTVSSNAMEQLGNIAPSTLSAIGLGNLTVMSDTEGMQVRGQGYRGSSGSAQVWGSGFALYKSEDGGRKGRMSRYSKGGDTTVIAIEKNGYEAQGKHEASGFNIAVVGKAGGKLELGETENGFVSGSISFYPKGFAAGYSMAHAR